MKLRSFFVLTLAFAFGLLLQSLAAAQENELRAALIDVEGGQATLFVAPTGESLLIDTGWSGHEMRDADRIASTAKSMGVTKIDYVLITHFHEDHVGGVPQLLQRIPVGTFLDHGPSRETNTPELKALYDTYARTLANGHYAHIVPKPGDMLPLRGIHAEVLSADGALIAKPLAGAGAPNRDCAATAEPVDQTENSRSLGIEITFAGVKILDLGDLTRDKEQQLVCPVNRIGTVDVLIVSHHGWSQSSSEAFLHAIRPRVALMDNGATKGGSTSVLDAVLHTQGLEDLWQLHYSEEGGPQHNTTDKLVANPHGADAAYPLLLTVSSKGVVSVTNSRTGISKSYAPEPGR